MARQPSNTKAAPDNLDAPLGSSIFDNLSDGQELASAGYWKPSAPGDVILGAVEGFTVKTFPGKPPKEQTSALLARALTFNLGGECTGAHEKLKLPLNSTLIEKVTAGVVGHCIAVEYQGMTATPAGEMRVFRACIVKEERHAKAWEKFGDAAPGATATAEDVDDLPF